MREFAKQERLTLNTLVQAAWAFVLSRYCGEDDVVFGVTVSGRSVHFPDFDEIVGPLLNTLPLRVQLERQTKVTDWIASIQNANLEIREHEHTPLAKIQRWSEVPPGESLFETLIAFENIELPDFSIEDLTISDPIYVEESNYPLALLVFPEDAIRIVCVHQADQFPDELASQMLNHVVAFLERLPDCREMELGRIPFFTNKEIDDEKEAFEQRRVEIPEVCIHDLIAEQVQLNPGATAVVFDDRSLTYQELSDQAEALAERLRGIEVGEPIGLFVERSMEMIVGILGILKAGGAYVPLDPSYPASRIAYLIEDSAAKNLVTTKSIRDQLPKVDARVFCVDDQDGTVDESLSATSAIPSSNAYIIYTSGSTGNPKGVAITHGNLVHSTAARIIYYDELPDVFLLFPSFSFDSSVAGIFWTLCTGGAIVIPLEGEQHLMHRLAELIEKWSVTHLLCLPSICDLLFDAASKESLASLKTVIVAGESCSAQFIRKHRSRWESRAIYNEYGPTECSVWASVQKIDPAIEGDVIPIGAPISNTRVYILDRNGNQTPTGVVGELCISGLGVSPGYWRRPELTEVRFVATPDNPSERMYRTGDLACIRADGTIEFLGRIDDQLKIRGIRIEPGEIEAIIAEDHRVDDVIVTSYVPLESHNLEERDVNSLSHRLEQIGNAAAERLLAEIETLSDEEARQLLSEDNGNPK